MTQQSEANVQVLGIFRFCLAISLMLFLMWGVTSQYQEQRRQAQIAVIVRWPAVLPSRWHNCMVCG